MSEISKITALLGEENEKRLKDGITDLLLGQISEDLSNMSVYLIDLERLFDEVEDEIRSRAKEMLVNRYAEKFEKKLNELIESGGYEI